VCITELCERDAWVDEPLGAFDEGGFVRCVVTKVAKDKKRARGGGAAPPIVDLSMRASHIAAASAAAAAGDAKAFKAEAPLKLALDDVITGYVAATSTKGCFVRVASDVTARVMLKNLSDAFVDDVAETFPAGKLVAARVIEVKEIKGKGRAVELSMKQSVVAGGDDATPRLRWAHLEVGATLQGRVRRVEAYGVFVTLDGGDICGLCHKSNASDTRIKELGSIYAEGDSVQVKIMALDKKTKKISLGMKPSLFANDR
jgi:rRNA biogenesis protein RRP5